MIAIATANISAKMLRVLGGGTFWVWTRNSVIVAVGTTLVGLLLAVPAGYAFSRYRFSGRRQAMFLFMLPAIILSGFLYPIETMPEVFQLLTLGNPLRHFLEIVRGIFLQGAGFEALHVQFTVLTGMAGVGLWLATWRFERSL